MKKEFFSPKNIRWQENCGLFGIHSNSDVARLTYLGLCTLQSPGQENASIAEGLISAVF